MKMKGKAIRRVLAGLLCLLVFMTVLPMNVSEAASSKKYAAPTLKSVSSTSSGVKFQWKKVSGATKYRVYRKTSESGKWKKIATVTTTSYTDTSAKSGSKYYYTVCATGGSKKTGPYNEDGLSITYIATPKLKSISSSQKGITLKWKSVKGAKYYQILRKKSGGSFKRLVVVTGTSYTDESVGLDKSYTYTVRVVGEDKRTYISQYDHTGLTASFAGKVAVSSLKNVFGGVEVKWNTITGASSYQLFRKFGEGDWKLIKSNATSPYTDTGAVNNITYTYRVKALDSAGDSMTGYDETGKSITYYAAPTPKSVTPIEKSGDGLLFTWQAVEGVSNYHVYRKIGNAKWTSVGYSTETSYQDNSIPSTTSCRYTVCCADASGNDISAYDNTGVSWTPNPFYAVPVLVSTTNGNGCVVLTWNNVYLAQFYNVYRRTGDHTEWGSPIATVPVSGGDTTTYSDSGVTNAKGYTYTVSVADSSGNDLSDRNTTGISTTYYDPPKNLKAENAATGVKITWDAADGIGSYIIYRKTGSATWTNIGTASTNEYIDTTAVNNGNYRYTVSCQAGGAEVSAHNSSGVAAKFYSAPTVTSATNDDSCITITWDPIDGIDTYRVYRQVGTSGTLTKVADVPNNGTSYDDYGLTAGKKYIYAVRCVIGTTEVSANANTKQITRLDKPAITASSAGSKKTKVSWGAVTGASKYEVYRKTANSGWKLLTTLSKSYTSYTDTSGTVNTDYTYKVVAIASDGSVSPDSNTATQNFN